MTTIIIAFAVGSLIGGSLAGLVVWWHWQRIVERAGL